MRNLLRCSCCGGRELNWSDVFLWRGDKLCWTCYRWLCGFDIRPVL